MTAATIDPIDIFEAAASEVARRQQVRQAARVFAPARPARYRVPANTSSPLTPSSAQLTVALQAIDRSNLVPYFEQFLPPARNRATGGAPRIMSTKGLLAGLLLLAMLEQPLLLRDVARLLDNLAPTSRHLLDLPARRTITERMVSRLWNQLAAHVDSSVYAASNADYFNTHWWAERGLFDHLEPTDDPAADKARATIEMAYAADTLLSDKAERLRHVITLGLKGTLDDPRNPTHTGSYAQDATLLPSWCLQKSKRSRRALSPQLRTDPDATWRVIKGRGAVLGYAVHTLVRIPEAAPPNQAPAIDIPALIEAFDITGAGTYNTDAGIDLLARTTLRHEDEDQRAGSEHRPRRDLLADREYSRDADWQAAAFSLGFTTVFDLASEQRGLTGVLTNGALVIDGLPYSPGTPAHLHQLRPLSPFSTVEERAHVAQLVLEREAYRLRAQGARRDDGSINLACPASSLVRSMRCNNKTSSLKYPRTRPLIGTALPVITNPIKPSICTQQKSRVDFDELPFWQPDAWMSPQWQASYNRRNIVEGVFGNLKTAPGQDISRGNLHVMGRAKTSLLVLFAAMAYNLASLERYTQRQAAQTSGATVTPITRIPRLRTRRLRDVAVRIEARRIRRELEALAEEDPFSDPPDQGGDPPGDPPSA